MYINDKKFTNNTLLTNVHYFNSLLSLLKSFEYKIISIKYKELRNLSVCYSTIRFAIKPTC